MKRGHSSASVLTVLCLTLTGGCTQIPEFYGPLCDDAEEGRWEQASMSPELDHIEYAKWTDDPELEAFLKSFGMDNQWEYLSGNDVDEDGIVVSPYGKTLNAYELILMTPELADYGHTLAQSSYPVHGSCGEKGPGVVAYTWMGRQGHRTDLYVGFYDRSVVSRASFLLHEVGHALGMPDHIGNKDRNWEAYGPYRLQVEFLAAVYHTESLSQEHRDAAAFEFRWMIEEKFVEAPDITLEDLRPR